MPTAKGLTDTQIKNAKPGPRPYKMYDRDRLYVNVSVAGTKRWYWAYRVGQKDMTASLGEYPEMTLAGAREAQAKAKSALKNGLHVTPVKLPKIKPAHAAAQSIAQTTDVPGAGAVAGDWESQWKATPGSLADISREWLKKKIPGWGAGHADKVRKLLERYVRDNPIGALPVGQVETGDLYALVTGVANRTSRQLLAGERKDEAPHNAIILRRAVDAVFRLAIMKGKIKTNPMADLRASEVIENKQPTRHNAKLGDAGITELHTAVEQYGGQRLTKLAIELLMCTALRTVELRGADWKEIDWVNRVWSVPASRMKRRIAHKVPLSAHALELLEKLKVLTGGKGWIFPNSRRADDYMASTTINSALTAMGFGADSGNWFRAHGVRGTFYSWALRNKYQSEAVDQQLAHLEPDEVKRAYLEEEFWPERVKLMNAWADYLHSLRPKNI